MEYLPSYRDSIQNGTSLYQKDALYHHGIKGMRWGIRRYQDSSGKLTEQGKKRYAKRISRLERKIDKSIDHIADTQAYRIVLKKRLQDDVVKNPKKYDNQKHAQRAVDLFNKRINSSEKTLEKGKKKTLKLVKKAEDIGLDISVEPTIRKGKTYFVESAIYANGMYYERGTNYEVPVKSMKVRLT